MTHSATKDLHRFDVCNGDADGLTAVLQWRLHDPAPATLITGLKREIALLERVPDSADEVLVCDLSIARNREALLANELAATEPRQAQAVLRRRPEGGFVVSVRAPRAASRGAGAFCAAFGGGGREAAAGIDALPARDYDRFVADFSAAPWGAGMEP